jgi:hypothetical protein
MAKEWLAAPYVYLRAGGYGRDNQSLPAVRERKLIGGFSLMIVELNPFAQADALAHFSGKSSIEKNNLQFITLKFLVGQGLL